MPRARGRWLLFFTPISAVVVVLLGVVAGGVRPFRSARVYSGPTEGITDLRLRVELGERIRVVEVPAPGISFTVLAVAGGQKVAQADGRTDSSGSAEVRLRLPRPLTSAFELRVEPSTPDSPPLARGLVLAKGEPFRFRAGRRGGFQQGRHAGELELAAAPVHGVLVTAQGVLDDELVLRARRAGAAVPGLSIDVELEGAEPRAARVTTDGGGLARLRIRPVAAQVQVTLESGVDGGGRSTTTVRLEVVQGAIRATRRGGALLLESSGAATEAFVGFFDERQRLGGARVELRPAPDGHLVGELPWPSELTASPLWVVTSSQADLASPSAVGWPVIGFEVPDPKTFDARELLLLDGAPAAQVREERRARRIRWVTSAYAAAALLVTLLLFVRRVSDADADIEAHLAREGVDDGAGALAPARRGRAVLAASCIALGFVVLCVFALLKN